MPTTLPPPTAKRQSVGFRRALASAALQVAAKCLLGAARACVRLAERLERP